VGSLYRSALGVIHAEVEASSSFLKKRTKKLLKLEKSFCIFFQKEALSYPVWVDLDAAKCEHGITLDRVGG
jgi:hypothetical protein